MMQIQAFLNDDADLSILNDDALTKIEDVDMQADQPPPSKICNIKFEAGSWERC